MSPQYDLSRREKLLVSGLIFVFLHHAKESFGPPPIGLSKLSLRYEQLHIVHSPPKWEITACKRSEPLNVFDNASIKMNYGIEISEEKIYLIL